ncbi:MAG: hypothetical protein ABS58_11535 [Mesorhizobium sp. SCN 65-20]|nr:MAG: hypothetical protein ABS58_11535 [Mesorhizobium sp. SCN 65-20]
MNRRGPGHTRIHGCFQSGIEDPHSITPVYRIDRLCRTGRALQVILFDYACKQTWAQVAPIRSIAHFPTIFCSKLHCLMAGGEAQYSPIDEFIVLAREHELISRKSVACA